MSRKTFVLDTSVILYDPEAILKFPDNDLVLPLAVMEDLDRKKRLPNELGKSARRAVRLLGSLKDLAEGGNWKEGVTLENGSCVRIQLAMEPVNGDYPGLRLAEDSTVLLYAYTLHRRGERVVFVTKDFAGRVKAEALGIEAEDYENYKFQYQAMGSGVRRVEVDKVFVDNFIKDGRATFKDLPLQANEFVELVSPDESSAVARYNGKTQCIEPLGDMGDLWGIQPKNIGQRCAIELLLRDDIKLVSLVGNAGTGKTLIALASGLRKVFDECTYSRILISRPIIPLGRDIGYLPGSKEEKLYHWMQPIYDNLAFLCDASNDEPNETLRWVTESKKLEMEAVTYIRGRTLPKMYIIIDEAQNLTPHEIKTVISRAGEGTKVVLTGDPTQIDNPYLDADSNGLTFTLGRFKDQPIFGHIQLETTERSELAAIAAEVM